MGTSKGYVAPNRPEWSKAKRAVTTYLKNGGSESRANAISKYAEAMRIFSAGNTNGSAFGSSFSSAAGNVISFVRGVTENGLDQTLSKFERDDLIGKPPKTIIHELLNRFTNHGSTAEDALALAALSSAFDALEIETPDDIANIDLDAFLLELIIFFVENDFDYRFYEKISQLLSKTADRIQTCQPHGRPMVVPTK